MRSVHPGRLQSIYPVRYAVEVAVGAGGDGAQVFLNRVYGVMVCGLRITEAPAGMEAKNVTWGPLNVTQGPTEPKSLHGVLADLLAFFKRHDPGVNLRCYWIARCTCVSTCHSY